MRGSIKRLDTFLLQQDAIYDQLQDLIDDNNQLKVDKAILEKENELLKEDQARFKDKINENDEYEPISKVYQNTLDAKDSLISELEFKIFELENNAKLKSLNSDFQKKAIDELNEELKKNEKYKIVYEEAIEDNQILKKKIEQLENRNESLYKQSTQLKKEKMENLAHNNGQVNLYNQRISNFWADRSYDNIITGEIANEMLNNPFGLKDSPYPMTKACSIAENNNSNQFSSKKKLNGISLIASRVTQMDLLEKKCKDQISIERQSLKLFRQFDKSIQDEIEN